MKPIKAILLYIFIAIILTLTIRGNYGNPNSKDINNNYWKEGGPLELSPERGRFALLYSIIEDKSFFFSIDLARFTTPDLGYKNGRYVSLFAPAISYIASLGYLVGKYFNASQVGAFSVIAIFALLNGLLIRSLSKMLGANDIASNVACLVYLFATPSFAYSVTLYQHQISTFLILSSLSLLFSSPGFIKLFLILFLCAVSIPVDYPNLILMAPIGIATLGWIIKLALEKNKLKIEFKPLYLFAISGIVLPLIFFFWFNYHSYGNPLQFSGTVKSVAAIDQNGNPTTSRLDTPKQVEITENSAPVAKKKSAVGFFKTRHLLNGFYIHIFSKDRGIVNFTPVILFGLLGIVAAAKKKTGFTKVLVSILGANLILYSLWGDPWGGWAFGSRYLIPSYAILSIFIATFLTEFGKRVLYVLPFWLIATYSIFVNAAGALSTSAMPPKVQVLELEKISGTVQKYTYERNLDYLKNSNSKSFVYNQFFKGKISGFQYYQIISGAIVLFISTEIITMLISKRLNEN